MFMGSIALTPTTIEKNATLDEDRAVIQRFLAGEESAFTVLVNKYRRQVYAVAYRFTTNHEEADDLAQETFIKAYQNLSNFRGEASLKTWLLRITTNLSINYKKSSRVAKDSGLTAEDTQADSSSEGGALDDMLHDERKTQLYAAIKKLPARQKEALMLKTFQYMSCDEVAKTMKCSDGTVKANVFNALKRLKTLMNPGGSL